MKLFLYVIIFQFVDESVNFYSFEVNKYFYSNDIFFNKVNNDHNLNVVVTYCVTIFIAEYVCKYCAE
jgi:hypothetical protein